MLDFYIEFLFFLFLFFIGFLKVKIFFEYDVLFVFIVLIFILFFRNFLRFFKNVKVVFVLDDLVIFLLLIFFKEYLVYFFGFILKLGVFCFLFFLLL